MELLKLQAMILAFSLITLFVSQEEYTKKVLGIGRDTTGIYDFKGWQRATIPAKISGLMHSYFFFPGPEKDAPSIVFLHGLNFDARSFLNLKSLATKYRLIAYDFPEESSLYKGSIDDFVSLVDDFVTQLKLQQFYIAGVSFGGVVACRFTAIHPSAIKSLIILSSPLSGYSEEDRKKMSLLNRWIKKVPDYKLYWALEMLVNRFGKKHPGNDFSGMLRMKKMAFYRQVIASVDSYNESIDARKITMPVLVLLGTDDDEVKTSVEAGRFREHIPQADIQIIQHGEHAMTYLAGGDIAGRIDVFLEKKERDW